MRHLLLLSLTLTAVAVASDQVPFTATFTSTVPGGALPSCPADYPVAQSLIGAGLATHLGQFTETQSHCLDPNTGKFTLGQGAWTGADGAKVFFTYSGHLVTSGSTAQVYGVFVITGGTGRFTGVTGGGLTTGSVDLSTYESNDHVCKGTISRPTN